MRLLRYSTKPPVLQRVARSHYTIHLADKRRVGGSGGSIEFQLGFHCGGGLSGRTPRAVSFSNIRGTLA